MIRFVASLALASSLLLATAAGKLAFCFVEPDGGYPMGPAACDNACDQGPQGEMALAGVSDQYEVAVVYTGHQN